MLLGMRTRRPSCHSGDIVNLTALWGLPFTSCCTHCQATLSGATGRAYLTEIQLTSIIRPSIAMPATSLR